MLRNKSSTFPRIRQVKNLFASLSFLAVKNIVRHEEPVAKKQEKGVNICTDKNLEKTLKAKMFLLTILVVKSFRVLHKLDFIYLIYTPYTPNTKLQLSSNQWIILTMKKKSSF